MGYWSRAETELIINLEGREPALAQVYTNWTLYANRLQACEGFQERERWTAPDGKLLLQGSVSLTPFRFLHLRSTLAASQHQEFEAQRALLPAPVSTQSRFRLGAGERETLICATQDEPFWMTVCTDMLPWLRRLEEHAWAVQLEEVQYAGADDGGSALQRTYAVPRQLLQVRRSRPQLSDEQRQGLLARLGS